MFNFIHLFMFVPVFISGFDESTSAKYSSFCRRGVVYVGLPWDCSGFIQCIPATGERFLAVWIPCSGNLQYDKNLQVCVHGKGSCSNLAKVAEEKCPRYPNLKFLHPDSCAMYYDCRQKTPINGMKMYENECAHPLVFHQDAQVCWPQFLVKCGKRPVPTTKCDYRLACKADICNNKPTGSYPVPGREFGKEYIVCQNNTIVEKPICLANDEVFDPIQGKCSNTYTQSISTYCQKNPTMLFEDMNRCSFYYDCSKALHHAGLKPYQTECKYPNLFDSQDKKCKAYNEVICEKRPEPKQPCEYDIGHCFGRPACISCEAACGPSDIGQFAHPADPSKIITCKDGRTTDIKTCPLGKSFDSTTKQCEKACTCDAEIRALALAMENIQKFLAPKGLPLMTCDKPLENILRQTKQTTEIGTKLMTCTNTKRACPFKSSLTCAAGLIFGTWSNAEQPFCAETKFKDINGLTSPVEVPCVNPVTGSIYILAEHITTDQPILMWLESDNGVLIKVKVDVGASKVTTTSSIQNGKPGPTRTETLPVYSKIMPGVDFVFNLFYTDGGYNGQIGSSSKGMIFTNYPHLISLHTAKTFKWNAAVKVKEVEFRY